MQLLVPGALRQNFLRKAHTGMTGGHLGVKCISLWTRFSAELFGTVGEVMSKDSANSAKGAVVTFVVICREPHPCSPL